MAYKDPEKQKAAQRASYERNRAAITGRRKTQRQEFIAVCQAAKNVPCTDCGVRYPSYVMDFDHLPGSVKLFTISKASAIPSMEALKAEIQKCEVVCSNCHRIRTFTRNEVVV